MVFKGEKVASPTPFRRDADMALQIVSLFVHVLARCPKTHGNLQSTVQDHIPSCLGWNLFYGHYLVRRGVYIICLHIGDLMCFLNAILVLLVQSFHSQEARTF